MATALAEAFARAAREGRRVFIPFITAGFPSPADTVPILLAMEKVQLRARVAFESAECVPSLHVLRLLRPART
jgi:hypothetical protein